MTTKTQQVVSGSLRLPTSDDLNIYKDCAEQGESARYNIHRVFTDILPDLAKVFGVQCHVMDTTSEARSYEVHISSKGTGAFASRALLPGTVVVAEKPILTLKHPSTDNEILNAFSGLTQELQQRMLQLSHGGYKERSPITVYLTNNMFVSEKRSGIFPSSSRFNHSCVPNVTWGFDDKAGDMVLKTTKSVEAGEELCIDYIASTNQPRKVRQAELNIWGFTCYCPACEDPTSDLRRKAIRILQLNLQNLGFHYCGIWVSSQDIEEGDHESEIVEYFRGTIYEELWTSKRSDDELRPRRIEVVARTLQGLMKKEGLVRKLLDEA